MIRRYCAADRASVLLLLPLVFGLAFTNVGSRPAAAQAPSGDRTAQTLRDRARTPQGRPSPRAAQPTALTSSASTVFTRAGVSLTGVTDGGIAVGDVDGQNGPDLLVVGTTDQSRNSPSAALYLRQSDGTFERADANLDPIQTGAAAIADVDGKNGPDLFITGTDENLDGTTTLYLQQSDGTFDPANRGLPSLVSSSATAIADVDGQNGPDVLLSRSGETTLYLQQSDGSFSAANVDAFLPPVDDGDYSVADVDGQNGPDLLITGDGEATLFLQQSDGTFDPANANLTGVTNSSTSIADVDGRNGPDVLIAGDTDGFGAGGESATLYLQQSDGSFSPADAGLNGVTRGATAIADVDGQNGPDLVVAGDTTAGFRNSGGESATLYLQQSDGSFSPADAGLTPVRGDASASMTDVDGDSDPDLVLTGYGSFLGGESARLYVNRTAQSGTNRDPRFVQSISSTAQAAGTTVRTRFEVGDPDGDPLTIDLAEGEAASGVSLTDAGNGTAEFAFAPQRSQIGETIDIAIEATDGRGGVSTLSFQLTVPKTFVNAKADLTGLFFGTASIANVDGENGPDLLTAGVSAENRRSATLYLQQSGGEFSNAGAALDPISTGTSSIADVDTDGDQDLLIGGRTSGGGQANLYLQQSDGSFSSEFVAGQFNSGSSSIADVDRDGNPDLLITGNGYTALLLQQDDGSFARANAGLTDVSTGASSIADVDGKNGPDLLITGAESGETPTATLYLQQPDSSFSPANLNLTGAVGGDGSTAIADVDGQNGPDLLIAGDINDPLEAGGESATLYLQQSDGSFTEANAGLRDVGSSSTSIGDVDGQNGPDLLIAGDTNGPLETGGGTATLYLQQSDGSFDPAGAGLLPVQNPSTAIADVNQDGAPEPFIVGETSQFANTAFERPTALLYDNVIDADFTPPAVPTGLAATIGPGEITLSWNANTEGDLAEYRVYRSTSPIDSTGGPSGLTALQTVSSGTTTFTDPQVEGGTMYYYRVTAVDTAANESGFSSEVQATPEVPLRVTGLQPESGAPGTPVRIRGTGFSTTAGDNTVTFGSVAATVDSATTTVLYARVPDGTNGGPTQVSVSSEGETATATGRFTILIRGSGSFAGRDAGLVGVRNSASDWGDFDGDGDLDLVVVGTDTSGTPSATIYENRSDGSFEPIGAGLTGVTSIPDAKWGDFDADGDLDLVVVGTSSNGRTATIYENDGSGAFSPLGAGLTGVDFGSVDWGDYDNDGDLDLIITGDDGPNKTARIYQNQGDGTFATIGAGLTGVRNSDADWGDYDGDGDLDLIVTGGSTATIYENQGGGSFSSIGAGLTGVRNGSVAKWGDYDGDGDLDVVVAGRIGSGSDPLTRLYENEGGGTFTAVEAGLTDVDEASVDWVDFDGNGTLDLVLTGLDPENDRTTVLYANEGDGRFSTVNDSMGGVVFGSSDWGDANGDGALDLLVTGVGTSTIYENGGGTLLSISPDTLGYGRVGVADTLARPLTLTNQSGTALPLTLSLKDGTSFGVVGDTARTLGPGQVSTVPVAFVPDGEGPWRDSLRVEVPDSIQTEPLAGVALGGTGVSVEAPTVDVEAAESATVTVQVPDDFAPTQGALFTRRAGTSRYQRTLFEPTGQTASVQVPDSVLSARGVQYWVRLVEPPSQQGTRPGRATQQDSLVVTFPPKNPRTRPAQIRTRVSRLSATGPFRARRYRMVSVPFDLGDRSLSSVFRDQYGDYNPGEWRLARYAPGGGTYREYPALDTTALRPGRAYWLTTADGTDFAVENARSVDVTGPDTLVVEPGWNQIATPFAFPVAWSDVRGTGPIDEVVGYDPSQPRGERYQYGASVLRPWRGVFVYNTAEEPVRLSVPPREAPDTVGTTAARASKGGSSSGAGPASSYRLRIDAAHDTGDETLRDRQTWVGFRTEAQTGLDDADVLAAPPVGEHLRVRVIPEEGPPLAGSLKPAGKAGRSWDLSVSARVRERFFSEKTVRLHFDEDGQRPEDFGRYVLDLDRGTRLPVEEGTATIRLTEDTPTRHLRVIVGTRTLARSKADGIPLEVLETTLKPPYPNPVSETATIAYEIKTKRPVTIAVYDVLGRRVQTLVHGKREAGRYQVEWPRSRAGGDRLASGMYFVRMQAGGVSETRKVTLVR